MILYLENSRHQGGHTLKSFRVCILCWVKASYVRCHWCNKPVSPFKWV